jgi:hypothetical protein
MKKNLLLFLLMLAASGSFLSCRKIVDFCKCGHCDGKDTCHTGEEQTPRRLLLEPNLSLTASPTGKLAR